MDGAPLVGHAGSLRGRSPSVTVALPCETRASEAGSTRGRTLTDPPSPGGERVCSLADVEIAAPRKVKVHKKVKVKSTKAKNLIAAAGTWQEACTAGAFGPTDDVGATKAFPAPEVLESEYGSWHMVSNRIEQLGHRITMLQSTLDTELPARIREILVEELRNGSGPVWKPRIPSAESLLDDVRDIAIAPLVRPPPRSSNEERTPQRSDGGDPVFPDELGRASRPSAGDQSSAPPRRRSTILEFLFGGHSEPVAKLEHGASTWHLNNKSEKWPRLAAYVETYDAGVMCFILFLNAIVIGVETSWFSQDENLYECSPPLVYKVLEVFFFIAYTVELMLRVAIDGRDIFTVKDGKWNLFNTFLLIVQVVDFALLMYDEHTDCELSNSAGSAFGFDILGLLRIMRLARLARVLYFNPHLRLIVTCLASSLQASFWTSVLLIIVNYIMSIWFTQAARSAREPHDASDLKTHFGAVATTNLNLFKAMSGGIDWGDLHTILKDASPLNALLFVFHIFFMVLIMLNLVTGIFVEAVVERTEEQKTRSSIQHLTELFSMIDEDNDGCVSWLELERRIQDAEVQQAFENIGIDITDVSILFRLLDRDNDGLLNPKEFLHGCLRLRLPTKAMDLAILLRGLFMPDHTGKSSFRCMERCE